MISAWTSKTDALLMLSHNLNIECLCYVSNNDVMAIAHDKERALNPNDR